MLRLIALLLLANIFFNVIDSFITYCKECFICIIRLKQIFGSKSLPPWSHAIVWNFAGHFFKATVKYAFFFLVGRNSLLFLLLNMHYFHFKKCWTYLNKWINEIHSINESKHAKKLDDKRRSKFKSWPLLFSNVTVWHFKIIYWFFFPFM